MTLIFKRYFATCQHRFKSIPSKFPLVFPKKTPSGFTTGTILKTRCSRKECAISWSDTKKSIKPWMINEEGASDARTLPKMTITFGGGLLYNGFDGYGTSRVLSRLHGFVMVNIWHGRCWIVRAMVSTDMYGRVFSIIVLICSLNLAREYGWAKAKLYLSSSRSKEKAKLRTELSWWRGDL